MTPSITCPANIAANTDAGLCTVVVTYTAPIGTDNCTPTTTQTAGLASGADFPKGVTTNTFMVSDASGNTALCSFDVTVTDIELPTITCPTNVSVNTDAGLCSASSVTLGTPTSADNCIMVTNSNDAVEPYAKGVTNVTWKVTDMSNNTATCIQTVTVTDIELPTITCPTNVSVNTDAGLCSASNVTLGTPTSADNCIMVTNSNNAVEPYAKGVTNVTWTVTDMSNNTATCIQTVTVTDIELPTISCPTDVTVNTDAGLCTASNVALGTPTSADNCIMVTNTNNAVEPYALGVTNVTWKVTDMSNNSATCMQTVTVEDNELPVITCPANATRNTDANVCSYTIVNGEIDATYTDNCMASTITNSLNSTDSADGEILALGANTVLWTVDDGHGNSATCSVVVTVVDAEAPMAVCKDITVQLDANGAASITTSDVDNGSSDECGSVTLVIDITSFACAEVGANTVTLTVTDQAANTATCTSTVTVEDNVAPVAICQDITVQLDNSGMATIAPADVNNGSHDACGIASTSIDIFNFDCGDLGTNVVTLTVTDVNSNSSSCTSNVVVEDNVPPMFTICPSSATVSTSPTSCFADYTGVFLAPVTDNCTPIVLANLAISAQLTGNNPVAINLTTVMGGYNINAPNGLPVGDNTITIVATDGEGNSSTCQYVITVEDTYAPIINNCPADITVTAPNGACTQSVVWQPPTISDFCPNYSVVVNFPSGSLFPVGQTTTVTYVATDQSGNSTTCSFNVTVNGNCVPPTTDIRVRWQTPFIGTFFTGQTRDAVIRLNEIAGIATSGAISVYVPPISGYSLAFDPNQTTATNPNVAVTNLSQSWSSVTLPNGGLVLTTNNSIPASSEFKVAIKLTANASMVTSILRAQLLPGSGGESNNSNNNASINITTF